MDDWDNVSDVFFSRTKIASNSNKDFYIYQAFLNIEDGYLLCYPGVIDEGGSVV